MEIIFDLETRSGADLKAVGAWEYSCDPFADVICMAYSVDGGPVQTWQPGDAFFMEYPPEEFKNEKAVFIARNYLFEYAMTANVLIKKYGFPAEMAEINRWKCTRALCLQAGLPGGLAESAAVMKCKTQKLDDGKRLINTYSKPKKDRFGKVYFSEITSEDMGAMLEYCKADVEADLEIYNRLKNTPNWKLEYETFLLDALQNIKGLKIDTAGLDKVLSVLDTATERAEKEQAAAGVNTRSGKQLIEFLAGKGHQVANTQADTLAEVYERADEETKEVLSLRLFLSRASVKKFQALKDRVSTDGRLRYFLRYYGAHTGRWTSEGFQVHNIAKTYGEPVNAEVIDNALKTLSADMPYKEIIEQAKKILPGLIIPDPGKVFIMGDFASIELRVVAYLSGCKMMLEGFKVNADLYKIMASRIFGIKVEDIEQKSKERQLGKKVILGAQYGIGKDKFLQSCVKDGLQISEEIAARSITFYRETYSEIPAFWRSLENAVKSTIATGQPSAVGVLKIARQGRMIAITLPSGRVMYYHNAEIDGDKIKYMNYQQRKTCYVWGGSLCENICQAVARDILAYCMSRLVGKGVYTAASVHDELICEVCENVVDESKKIFDDITNSAPVWLPGFPLKTESIISKRYFK